MCSPNASLRLAHHPQPWISSKTALAKRLEAPATSYTDTMLDYCWNSVINDGTTFNQNRVSTLC